MIYQVLSMLSEQVNEYFRNKFNEPEDRIVLSGIMNVKDNTPVNEQDKILLSLVNFEEERITSRLGQRDSPKPINLNLFVVFAALFEEANYEEALKFLSGVISYFQSHFVFNHSNTPGLPPEIEKLSIEMVSLSMQELSFLWGIMGGKHLPASMYKIKVVPIKDMDSISLSAPISGFGTSGL